jgi:hypothetical protein
MMAWVLLLDEAMANDKMTLTACPVTDHAHAVHGQIITSAPYCRMGQDYDCVCRYCSSATAAEYAAKITAYNAATADHRAQVARVASAFLHLAAIGTAVRAALAPGLGVALMLGNVLPLLASTHGNLRGAHFRIVGKRGNAKLHTGKVGICRWIGEGDSFAPAPRYRNGWRPDTTAPTVRVGLSIEGEAKLVYVAHGQLERLPTPAAEHRARIEASLVRAAIAPLRAKLAVAMTKRGKPKAGQIAYVVEGRDAGASGTVFWCGTDKRTGETDARLGIKLANGETIWVNAYDCAASPVCAVSRDDRILIERIAADAVEGGSPEAAREVLAQLREAQA